jgi:hypothetical protein
MSPGGWHGLGIPFALGANGPQSRPKRGQGPLISEGHAGRPFCFAGEFLYTPAGGLADLVTRFHSGTTVVNPFPVVKPSMEVSQVLEGLRRAEFVYILRGSASGPLEPKYQGPYRVMERAAKFFMGEVGNSRQAVSVDWLKPHTGVTPASPAQPSRRGQPPMVAPAMPVSIPATYAQVVSGGHGRPSSGPASPPSPS